jgi:hypothetical protein
VKQSAKKSRRPTDWKEFGTRIDDEIEDFIRWFDQDVVPKIRQRSSHALRQAAAKLSDLAGYLDDLKDRQ